MKHALVVFGARPSAVKLAPVVHALEARGVVADVYLTGQHGQMLDCCLEMLGLTPICRQCCCPCCELGERLGWMTADLGHYLMDSRVFSYDALIVVGDTISGLAGALAGAYSGIPVAHVEAGLRTHDREPWPEEMTRRTITSLAHWHFAPTPQARSNLLRERVPRKRIWIVGNPVVDSLRKLGIERRKSPVDEVLVTLHRRENWENMPVLAAMVSELAMRHPFAQFFWPLHPNPAVSTPVRQECGQFANITLSDPLPYGQFLQRLAAASLVITDSGGVQEEAGTLGVPTLVVRDNTERPESLGRNSRLTPGLTFFLRAHQLLGNPKALAEMEKPSTVFGDGRAGERIADVLLSGSTPLGELQP